MQQKCHITSGPVWSEHKTIADIHEAFCRVLKQQ